MAQTPPATVSIPAAACASAPSWAPTRRKTRLFTIGLAQGIDVAALGELADRTGGVFFYANNAAQFLTLFGSVGKLMSLSLPTYRLR